MISSFLPDVSTQLFWAQGDLLEDVSGKGKQPTFVHRESKTACIFGFVRKTTDRQR